MAVVVASRQCYNMDKKKCEFWHATLKSRTTQISVGKKGENPKHYGKVKHATKEAAVEYLEKVIRRNKAAGYTLRKNRSVAGKHWTFSETPCGH